MYWFSPIYDSDSTEVKNNIATYLQRIAINGVFQLISKVSKKNNDKIIMLCNRCQKNRSVNDANTSSDKKTEQTGPTEQTRMKSFASFDLQFILKLNANVGIFLRKALETRNIMGTSNCFQRKLKQEHL